ncbi:MAG: hypothetical protein V4642_08040 [Bacteroidota bacterium]
MVEIYKIERTCSNCGHKQQIEVSKREAAFEIYDISKLLPPECIQCSGKSFITSYQTPNLDKELLEEWAADLELSLMPQDEELLLAEGEYLEMILEVLDNPETLKQKQVVLMEALCVIIYDNSMADNPQKDSKLKKRVITELNKRKDKLLFCSDCINGYIKDIVFPQLDL